jgi:hypothetical protein
MWTKSISAMVMSGEELKKEHGADSPRAVYVERKSQVLDHRVFE